MNWSRVFGHAEASRMGQGVWQPRRMRAVRSEKGCVANFAQEVVKGQLPLSVEGLRGQGVEQFGCSEALVSHMAKISKRIALP